MPIPVTVYAYGQCVSGVPSGQEYSEARVDFEIRCYVHIHVSVEGPVR